MKRNLIIIPARGGSKGIPRKNVRRLAGKPLIYYSVLTALAQRDTSDVYVTSDDDEILLIAERLGAKTHRRNPDISNDAATLDDVIAAVYRDVCDETGSDYDLVITLQPTSPLLEPATLASAIDWMTKHPQTDTLISAVDDRHLTWGKEEGKYRPNYTARVNRQYLPAQFRETGSFLIARKSLMATPSRIGERVELHLLSDREAVDIDTYQDWAICEYYLNRKNIVFLTSGYREIGLGHVYNTLSLANSIVDHNVSFVVCERSDLGKRVIESFNYPVTMAEGDILDVLSEIRADLIINDRLNSTAEYMKRLRAVTGAKIISIEDLGEGAKLADVVINAMYPERVALPNHYFGHNYFCLREEFLLEEPRFRTADRVANVLITFGGTDPNNFTARCLDIILPYCREHGIKVKVILGLGYQRQDSIERFRGEGVEILSKVRDMSSHMLRADLAITSAGRTTFELAAVGVPGIVLCQNYRETTHFFAYADYGFTNLGLGANVDDDLILQNFVEIVEDRERRAFMVETMKKADVRQGKENVLQLIKGLL